MGGKERAPRGVFICVSLGRCLCSRTGCQISINAARDCTPSAHTPSPPICVSYTQQISCSPVAHINTARPMIRRMADKFGQLGQPKHQQSTSTFNTEPSSSSSSILSRQSTSLEAHRGSISTQATSVSEWSAGNKRGESMEIVKPEPVVAQVPRTVLRPKATYRLSDFIIQRTLGTGSFGRVHLGKLI